MLIHWYKKQEFQGSLGSWNTQAGSGMISSPMNSSSSPSSNLYFTKANFRTALQRKQSVTTHCPKEQPIHWGQKHLSEKDREVPNILLPHRTAWGVTGKWKTVPWKDSIEHSYECKKLYYAELVAEVKQQSWNIKVYPVTVGSRGFMVSWQTPVTARNSWAGFAADHQSSLRSSWKK